MSEALRQARLEDRGTRSKPKEAAEVARWFAIQIRYRFEKKVVEQLGKKGVEAFLPLREETHRWSDRQQAVRIPLFPGYAFVRVDGLAESRRRVLQTLGLMGFVNIQGEAVPIPAKQIEDLQLLLKEKVPCSLYPFLRAGQRVRVRGGCLEGLEGVLAQHDKGKLVISIASIQRSLAIEIDGYELEMI